MIETPRLLFPAPADFTPPPIAQADPCSGKHGNCPTSQEADRWYRENVENLKNP